MKKIKLLYEAPEAETLVIRFEGSLLTGSELRSTTMDVNDRDDYDYEEI